MRKAKIDWDEAWQTFWARYARQGPKPHELQRRVREVFRETWKRIDPAVDIEEPIVITVDKDGSLDTSMAGWVLLGAIAAVGASDAISKLADFKKILDNSIIDIDKKWYEIQAIEDRLERLEMWWGIEKGMTEDR